mgnify:FL=1
MSGVGVEIFTAGDGINYPQKGKHVVTIHYVGYVRVCLSKSLNLPCGLTKLHYVSERATAQSLILLAIGESHSSSSSVQSKLLRVRWCCTKCLPLSYTTFVRLGRGCCPAVDWGEGETHRSIFVGICEARVSRLVRMYVLFLFSKAHAPLQDRAKREPRV